MLKEKINHFPVIVIVIGNNDEFLTKRRRVYGGKYINYEKRK